MRIATTGTLAAYDRKDAAWKRAKEEGYRSRAAYKLLELDELFGLLRPGQRVVDLGCWPGAWTQVAAGKVGRSGRVVGVDLVPTDDLGPSQVTLLTGDVCEPEVRSRVREALGGSADLVISDLAPKLSGIAAADEARHALLVELAIDAALAWLAPDGALLVKLFMDSEYEGLVRRLRGAFGAVRTRRPPSTRRGSSEIYAVARSPRPVAATPEAGPG
ncbi:RlmE family RNA methyltransferase [bacterium]|nr:RlmE family RNA methyltransferase [bacterium]